MPVALNPTQNVYVVETASDLPDVLSRFVIYHLLYDPGDGTGLYYSDDETTLTPIAIGGSGVTSFNSRTGAVTPVVGDYDTWFPEITGTETISGDWTFSGTLVVPEASVTDHEAAINHNALTNYVVNQHIDWTQHSGSLIQIDNLAPDVFAFTPLYPFVIYDRDSSSTDVDTLLSAGVFGLSSTNSNTSGNGTFNPLMVLRNSSDVRVQVEFPRTANNPIAYRGYTSSFTGWHYTGWTTTEADADLSTYTQNSANETITGAWGFSDTVTFNTNLGFVISSTAPQFRIEDTDGFADAKNWMLTAQPGTLEIRAYSDDYTSFNRALKVSRSGDTVTSIELGADLYIAGDTTGHFEAVTGNFGSVQVDGAEGSSGAYSGYSIGGRAVFMENGSKTGLYNDIENEWYLYGSRNGAVRLFYNGVEELLTQDSDASGNSSGAQAKDHSQTYRDVGFNLMPVYEIDANDTFDVDHQSQIWHKDAGGSVTFTCANTSDAPNGATWMVANEDTENLTIAQGTGVTLRWFDGGGSAPSTGNRTLAQGGVCTVYKYANTEYWVWGNGIT